MVAGLGRAIAEHELAGNRRPEVAYRPLKSAVFADHEEMVQAHPAAADTVSANFVHNTFLPYHLGASRYHAHRVTAGVIKGDCRWHEKYQFHPSEMGGSPTSPGGAPLILSRHGYPACRMVEKSGDES